MAKPATGTESSPKNNLAVGCQGSEFFLLQSVSQGFLFNELLQLADLFYRVSNEGKPNSLAFAFYEPK